jgi:short-subunit dehydrogenase
MPQLHHVLITGASSGIGAALAQELAARGAHLWLCARRGERLEALAADLERRWPGSGRPRALTATLDVRDHRALRAFIELADQRSGGLDAIVANAGVGRAEHAARLSWAAIEEVLEVNVLGAFATLHAGLACFLRRGRGTLCGISSLASLGGYPTSGAYSASKAALAAFLETLRMDLDGSGIRVVDVQPGFVVSEMTQGPAAHPLAQRGRMVATAEAAKRIADALEQGSALCTFPWQESLPLRLLRRGPRWLWRATLTRAARWLKPG